MFTRYLAPLILLLTGCVSTNTSQESVDYSLPIAAIGFWSGQATVREVMGETALSARQNWTGFISESGMVILTKEDDSIMYGDLDWTSGGEAEGTLYYHLNGIRYELNAEVSVNDNTFTGTVTADDDTNLLLVNDTFTLAIDAAKNAGFKLDVDYYDLDGDWTEYKDGSTQPLAIKNGKSRFDAIGSNCTVELSIQPIYYRYAEFYITAELSNCVYKEYNGTAISQNGSYTGYMMRTQNTLSTDLDIYLFGQNGSQLIHLSR